jgi:hypothetical protein
MPDFSPQPNPQDPEAIRRALLAAMLGGKPGVPGAAPVDPNSPPAQPGFQPPPAAGDAAQPTSAAAQPITSAKPAVAKPMTTPTTAADPGNQAPLPTFASEEEWNKANPAAPHTPYQAPDFKHRLLTGLFAGMQEYARPGEGAATVRDYLGNIQKNQDAETAYPDTSAAAQHQRYMTAAQGAEVPQHIQQLGAQIQNTQAEAKERQAKAAAEMNPPPKTRLVQVAGPDGHPIPAVQNQTTGQITDQEGKEIPDAKLWTKPEAEKNLEKITVLGPDGHPHVYGVNAKGEKVQDFGQSYVPPKESRQDKSADVVERETRTAIRKAQENYRGAEATANMQREFIKEAKGGNKAAVKIVPLEGALEITTSQGVHRINRTEVEQYGGAGSLWDKINGAIGKGLTGKDIPDNVLNDMDRMTQEVQKNAWERYNGEYEDNIGIAKNNGVANIEQHLPRIKQRGADHSEGSFDASKLTNFHTNGTQRIGWDGKQYVDASTGKPVQ